jgi:hypothetical protein
MKFVPPWCRCALVALAFSLLPVVSIAQFGGRTEPEENPFGMAPAADEGTADEGAAAAETRTADNAPPSFCHCIGEADSQSVARINAALAGPLKEVGLEFQEERLESVINVLQADYDLPIQLDMPALEDVGLSHEEPVSISVRNVSLRSALRLMLKQLQLTYVVADEVLIITTPEEAESQLVVCVYDVRDLASARSNTKELEKLANVVVACIASESWAKNGGGEAEIRALRPGLLVVSQTRAVHEEIASLFAAMRKILHGPAGATQPGMMGARSGREMFSGRGYGGSEGGYDGGRGGYGRQQAE